MEKVSPSIRKGSVLLADPYLLDPNFRRTVILLADCREEGVVGFVLNNPTKLKLSQAIDDLSDIDVPLYLGGPVEPESLNFIHRLGDRIPDSYEIVDGIFWGGNFEVMKSLIRENAVTPDEYRFFLGYSGWTPLSHLERELEENSWFVTQPRQNYVFDVQHDKLWGNVLKDMGGDYAMLVNAPPHPSFN